MTKVTVAILAGAMVVRDEFIASTVDASMNNVEMHGVTAGPGIKPKGRARASVTRSNVVWVMIEEMAEGE